jgi:hypothetical protein
MMKFLITFLVLSSIFIQVGLAADPQKSVEKEFPENSVLGVDFNSMLYKVRISFRSQNFSGLILFKNQEQDSSTHVVFMSEFGLTLLDVKYKNDDFEVVSSKEFFNDPRLINLIKDDFRVLLQNLEYVQDYRISSTKDPQVKKLKFSHLSSRFIYLYEPGFFVGKATKRRNMFKVVHVNIVRNESHAPKGIHFTHRGISLKIDLELINIKQ